MASTSSSSLSATGGIVLAATVAVLDDHRVPAVDLDVLDVRHLEQGLQPAVAEHRVLDRLDVRELLARSTTDRRRRGAARGRGRRRPGGSASGRAAGGRRRQRPAGASAPRASVSSVIASEARRRSSTTCGQSIKSSVSRSTSSATSVAREHPEAVAGSAVPAGPGRRRRRFLGSPARDRAAPGRRSAGGAAALGVVHAHPLTCSAVRSNRAPAQAADGVQGSDERGGVEPATAGRAVGQMPGGVVVVGDLASTGTSSDLPISRARTGRPRPPR